MSRHFSLRYPTRIGASFTLGFGLAAIFAAILNGVAHAQQPVGHFQHSAQNPPGMIGSIRLQQGGPVHGFFQPVQLTAPEGVLIGMPEQGEFPNVVEGAVHAGMLIGKPYRVQLLNLPEEFESRELYPTIEIIDRTYAPPGLERRFPIPVVFNENDLKLAAAGMLVTRVIYIEDPHQAIPGAQEPGDQLWHDAGPKANPLEVADQLGRPVAIVRLGGRQPDRRGGPDWEFLYGCPPWQRLSAPQAAQLTPVPQEAQPLAAPPMKSARASRAPATR